MWVCTFWAVVLSVPVLQYVKGHGWVKFAKLEGQQRKEPPPEICPTQEILVFEIRKSIVSLLYSKWSTAAIKLDYYETLDTDPSKKQRATGPALQTPQH